MNPLIIQMWFAGLIGMLIQIFVIKIPTLQTRFQKANVPFSINKFFQEEWLTMIGTFITILAAAYVWDELVGIKPEIQKMVKILFVFIGFTGSSIALALLSKTAKFLNGIIDYKTDIADGKSE